MENKSAVFNHYLKFILFYIVALVLIRQANPDTDSYWLSATGQYIFENHEVPKINPFIIHENFSMVVQQWIPCLINYFLYKCGYFYFFVYSVILFTLGLFLLWKYFAYFTNDIRIRVWALVYAGSILALFANTRPTSISFLILLTELCIMESYLNGKRKYLLFLPFLSILEINCHAAMWPIMFVLLLPYIVPGFSSWKNMWLEIKEKYSIPLLLSIFSMLFAGLLNPNGFYGIIYLFNSYGIVTKKNFITELASPEFYSYSGFLLILAIIILSLYVYIYRDKMDFKCFYMGIGTVILACVHNRNLWFLIFGITPLILKVFHLKDNIKIRYSEKEYAFLNIFYIILFVVFTIVSFNGIDGRYKDSSYSPIEAMEYLDGKDVVLYTEFNNGAFAELSGHKVYIDARPELFAKKINGQEDILEEYFQVYDGSIDYEKFIEKYQFTHLLVTENSSFDIYLRGNHYTVVVDGNGYYLYEI